MMSLRFTAFVFLLLWCGVDCRLSAGLRRRVQEASSSDETFKVIVSYKDGVESSSLRTTKSRSFRQGVGLAPLGAASAEVTLDELQALENDPNVEFVEENYVIKMYSTSNSEIVPYGLAMIQANSTKLPPLPAEEVASCRDSSYIRVAVVDSGLQADHPDIPCLPLDDPDTNCIGNTFDLQEDETWYEPSNPHGTHVTGTIGALGGNGLGVKGVMGDYGVCYITARVFGRNEDALLSTILDGVEWSVQQGANVINLSLGGGGYSETAARAYARWSSQGVLFIAAAGNEGADGVSKTSYPASFDSVMSVAAVDEDGKRANFSNFNDYVSVAAPGAGILSTTPVGQGSVAFLTAEGFESSGSFMEFSQTPDGSLSGNLTECPNLGIDVCPGAGGHICLVERGNITFAEKAQNCEAGGGAGIIVYNNVAGPFSGTLGDNTSSITIPVMGISQEEGESLMDGFLGKQVSLTAMEGYSFLDGTSMACPHVTGAAALLWRECRRCENVEIAQCLQKTALDIGPPGRDEEYGYGLIQIESAYDCLVNTVLCCQPSDADLLVDLPVDPEFNEQTGDTESDAPSDPPSDTPSDMPSDIPSDFPTDAPSFAFSGIVPDDLLSSLSVESFDDNELVEDSSSTAWPQTIAASGIVLLSLLIQLA